jgi:hypothetical protein
VCLRTKKDRNNNSKANNNIENKQTKQQEYTKKKRKMSITIQCVQLAFLVFLSKTGNRKKKRKRQM